MHAVSPGSVLERMSAWCAPLVTRGRVTCAYVRVACSVFCDTFANMVPFGLFALAPALLAG
eukprot:4057790-Prymnesium_polylepis.1